MREGEGVKLSCYGAPGLKPKGSFSWYTMNSGGIGSSKEEQIHFNYHNDRRDMDVNGNNHLLL